MKWKTMEELSTRFRTSQGHLYKHYKEKRAFRGLYIHRRRVTEKDFVKRDDLAPQHLWLYCANTAKPQEHNICAVCDNAVTPRRHVVIKDAVACIPCHRKAFQEPYDNDARQALGVG